MRHRSTLPVNKQWEIDPHQQIWHDDWWCATITRPTALWKTYLTTKEADKADKICHGCEHRFLGQFLHCREMGHEYIPLKGSAG